jgi:CDP-diacylglycerol--serine O-phosphatidyltransferase
MVKPALKKIAVLPTLLTLGNGVCGFASITWASKIIAAGDEASYTQDPAYVANCFALAGWFLIFAMFFDMLDGYVARLSKTASKFGGELDSLCDAISFGVAPAFLLLKMGPGWERGSFVHQVLASIAALYMVCTILRLARFNVENTPDPASHKRFRGLPSPGAAGCLASLAIFRAEFPAKLNNIWNDVGLEIWRERIGHFVEIVAPVGALAVALLMVSRVAYPHITKQILRGRRNLAHLIQVLMAALVILLVRDLALVVIFWAYALLFPLRGVFVRNVAMNENPESNPLGKEPPVK